MTSDLEITRKDLEITRKRIIIMKSGHKISRFFCEIRLRDHKITGIVLPAMRSASQNSNKITREHLSLSDKISSFRENISQYENMWLKENIFYCTKGCVFISVPDPGDKDGVQFSVPLKAGFHINFNRQVSQQSSSEAAQLRCPVYVYNCSLEHLKEQLVHPITSRQPNDIFFR